jgi:hypothetical protein
MLRRKSTLSLSAEVHCRGRTKGYIRGELGDGSVSEADGLGGWEDWENEVGGGKDERTDVWFIDTLPL